MAYSSLTGDPAKGAVPPGEYNVLEDLKSQWEALTGFTIEINDKTLLDMANAGTLDLADMGAYMAAAGQDLKGDLHMPWAEFGLKKDDYTSLQTTFGSEYQKLTGQAISDEALRSAFIGGQKGAGGLLTGSEYAQQLMNDATMQKTYGWLKYGMDYNTFQQQKLAMKQSFGNDLTDAQAVTQLGYWHTNQGANVAAHEQSQQSSQAKVTPGQSQSVIR